MSSKRIESATYRIGHTCPIFFDAISPKNFFKQNRTDTWWSALLSITWPQGRIRRTVRKKVNRTYHFFNFLLSISIFYRVPFKQSVENFISNKISNQNFESDKNNRLLLVESSTYFIRLKISLTHFIYAQ